MQRSFHAIQRKVLDAALEWRENLGQRRGQSNGRALCHNAETIATPRAGGDSRFKHVRTIEI